MRKTTPNKKIQPKHLMIKTRVCFLKLWKFKYREVLFVCGMRNIPFLRVFFCSFRWEFDFSNLWWICPTIAKLHTIFDVWCKCLHFENFQTARKCEMWKNNVKWLKLWNCVRLHLQFCTKPCGCKIFFPESVFSGFCEN